MTTDQNTTKNNQDLDVELDNLLGEAKKLNQDIDAGNKESTNAMDELDARVDKSIVEVEQIYSDLDRIEKQSGDELDKLILEEAADLARDE